MSRFELRYSLFEFSQLAGTVQQVLIRGKTPDSGPKGAFSAELLYEINTRCWLRDLSENEARAINLSNVPDAKFEQWERQRFTHIWLMGVWTGGPRARSAAISHPDQRRV